MDERIEIRELSSLEELDRVPGLLERIWGDKRLVTTELLRALSAHGNPVLAAFRGEEMVGAQMAFLGREEGRLILHSHITGVLPDRQLAGVGFRLKMAQRDWCLAQGIDRVTWTFDPMIARNAHFNLRKLGAVAPRFLRDFYGGLEDSINIGERTDRLEIRWDLTSPGVKAAAEGRPEPVEASGAPLLLGEDAGRPLPHPRADGPHLLVRVPTEYTQLREEDPSLARAWRDAVADALEAALSRGFLAVDFLREGAYVLERA